MPGEDSTQEAPTQNTRVLPKGGTEPKWVPPEKLVWESVQSASDTLLVEVFDKEQVKLNDDFIGRCFLPLKNVTGSTELQNIQIYDPATDEAETSQQTKMTPAAGAIGVEQHAIEETLFKAEAAACQFNGKGKFVPVRIELRGDMLTVKERQKDKVLQVPKSDSCAI